MLTWSMAHRWVIVLACLLVIVSIVPLFMFVGKNFLPVDDQSQFEINVRAPEGSTLRQLRPSPGALPRISASFPASPIR